MEDLHPDLLSQLLRRLDGHSLAAAACSAAFLRRPAAEPQLWEAVCDRAWPSLRRHRRLLPACFRAFFCDANAYPFLLAPPAAAPPPPGRLLWAVDLFHGVAPVLSLVLDLGTAKPGFLGSPLRLNLPGGAAAAAPPESAELSWLALDPHGHRAVNLSSRRPVSVKQDWHTGELRLRFAVVVGGAAATATAAYDGGLLKEVSLTVEDEDGKCMTGRQSLALLHAALHGGRRGGGSAEARRRYAEYQARKKERKERRARAEARTNVCCAASGFLLFLAVVLLPLQLNLFRSLS
ncbi:F-box protein At2g27310-like [Wolffia australiana]